MKTRLSHTIRGDEIVLAEGIDELRTSAWLAQVVAAVPQRTSSFVRPLLIHAMLNKDREDERRRRHLSRGNAVRAVLKLLRRRNPRD